jgi:Ca-activated chloride channel family protein
MSFAAPTLLWLALAAPAAAALAAWLWRRRLAATRAWAARGLWDRLLPGWSRRRAVASVALWTVALGALALGLARPRWGSSSERVERRGVDVVFVLDTSLSMAASDVAPSRLFVARALVRRLVAALPGNRVGLVLVEGEPVVATPLTVDAAVVDLLLDSAEAASLPVPGSLLAPALRGALRLFPEGSDKHRALVLVSDGEDHGGGLAAVAAELAERGVVVHAIGVGTLQGSPLALPGGRPNQWKRDPEGQVVVSRLHEETLETLSRATGGVYLRAPNAGVDPAPIAARIAAMDRRELEIETVSTHEERFQWPLLLAALCLGLHLALPPFAAAGETP